MAQILTFIFERWGIVNDEELQAKEIECREMVYNLMEPIVTFFDKLEALQEFGVSLSISIILRKNETKQDLIKFRHVALFSPVQSTLVKAIKNGNLLIWSGLDANLVTKHLPTSLNTEKIHLQQ